MKTEVVMKRELFGHEISQKSKSEYFSASDLVRAGNMWRAGKGLKPFHLDRWFNTQATKEFMQLLESHEGKPVKISARGRGQHTWVHPYVFIDIALAISPDLKIEVYGWLYDNLLKYRNDSGDSYKYMCGALYEHSNSKTTFYREIPVYCEEIREACGVEDWQEASEEQLALRDDIHETIASLCDILSDNAQAVRLGILKAKKLSEYKKSNKAKRIKATGK